MTKVTYRKKECIGTCLQSQRVGAHDHHGREQGIRQAGVALKWYLRTHFLIHKNEAERKRSKWELLGF